MSILSFTFSNLAPAGMPGMGSMMSLVPPFLFELVYTYTASVVMVIGGFVALSYLKSSENSLEKAERDTFLTLKVGLYIIQAIMMLFVILGVFAFIDVIVSKMTDMKLPGAAFKLAFGYLIGAGLGVMFIEAVLIRLGTEKNFSIRKLIYGILILLIGIKAMLATMGLITTIFHAGSPAAKGAGFHVPFSGTLVYLGSFIAGIYFYTKWFENEGLPQTCMPFLVGIASKSSVPQGMGAAAGAGVAAAGFGAQQQQFGAVQQAVQPQASQPMAAQPQVAQQQPVASPQPVAQAAPQANACPTCGKPGRYIEQYQRYWCDSCNKYL